MCFFTLLFIFIFFCLKFELNVQFASCLDFILFEESEREMPTINTSNEEYQLSAENNQSSVTTNEVRDRMKDYWIKHSQLASIQEMLLDSNAEEISDQEMPEILSMLPSFKGKKVLELGAGIGRFTNVLAKQAESVIAVDFIEKFIKKNEEINAHLNNIEFVHGDVTKLAFETNAFHIIFSNWLLMYLNDEEVLKLFEKSLRSLKEGGYFFFRESCFHASGNIKKCDNNENPTEYRSPAKYIDFIQSRTIEENEIQYGFELVLARPNRTYIEVSLNLSSFSILNLISNRKTDEEQRQSSVLSVSKSQIGKPSWFQNVERVF